MLSVYFNPTLTCLFTLNIFSGATLLTCQQTSHQQITFSHDKLSFATIDSRVTNETRRDARWSTSIVRIPPAFILVPTCFLPLLVVNQSTMTNCECYAIFCWAAVLELESTSKPRCGGPTRDGVAVAVSCGTLIYSACQENAMDFNNTMSVPILALFLKNSYSTVKSIASLCCPPPHKGIFMNHLVYPAIDYFLRRYLQTV